MTTTDFRELYTKHMDALIREVEAYETDELLWKESKGISNPGGSLCLHLLGNLNHFIGATLGHTGYVRNREAEFTARGIGKQQLLAELQHTKNMVLDVIGKLSADDLAKEFPFQLLGQNTTEFYLQYFLSHLQYHLGQMNYHRRLLS